MLKTGVVGVVNVREVVDATDPGGLVPLFFTLYLVYFGLLNQVFVCVQTT